MRTIDTRLFHAFDPFGVLDFWAIGEYCAKFNARIYKDGLCYVIKHHDGTKKRCLFKSALMNEVRYSLDKEKRAGD